MKTNFRIFIIAIIALLYSFPVYAERGIKIQNQANSSDTRTALIIGNSDYKNSPLKNPARDATDFASILMDCGFDVTLGIDATQRIMEKAIKVFGKKLRIGGVGLFYYADHGIQVDGRNYLIPVDADIKTESDVKYDALLFQLSSY